MRFIKWRKKRHFAQQTRVSQSKLWDTEFLLAKAKAEREGFRMEYDRTGERLLQLEDKLRKERANNKPDKKIIKKLKAITDDLTKDHKQLKERMEALDKWIEGPLEAEDGTDKSIKAIIEGQRSLVDLLNDYRKRL